MDVSSVSLCASSASVAVSFSLLPSHHLTQVKSDADIEHDRQSKPRQPLPMFVPDQFMVLYGMKV